MAVGVISPHIETSSPIKFLEGQVVGYAELIKNLFRAFSGGWLRFGKRYRLLLFFNPGEGGIPTRCAAGGQVLIVVGGEYRACAQIRRETGKLAVLSLRYSPGRLGPSHFGQYLLKFRAGRFIMGFC